MRPVCRTERFLMRVLCSILVLASGCRREAPETISTGEWLYEINRKAGLPMEDAPPYYMNITEDSIYWQSVQNAAGWGVITTDYPVDPGAPLTRGFAACTLMNLMGTEGRASVPGIKDISDSPYRDQIQQAVAYGLFDLDYRSCFRPDEAMDKQDSMKKLDLVLEYINERMPVVQTAAVLQDILEEAPAVNDLQNGTAVYPSGTDVKEGTIIRDEDCFYRVEEAVAEEDGIHITAKETDIQNVLGSFQASGSSVIDFSKAEIIEYFDGDTFQSSYTEPVFTKLAAVRFVPYINRSFEYEGYSIDWGISSTDIHVSVTREFGKGREFSSSFRLSNVRPVYEWKFEDGKIETGYFRIDCLTTEKFSLTGSASKEVNGDFSVMDPFDLLNTIHAVCSGEEGTDLIIPVCTLRIPLPDQPVLSLTVRLELTLQADGKAELTLTQHGSAGMEIRNGKSRIIHDFSNDTDGQCYASTKAAVDLLFGLNAGSLVLADIGTETGVEAQVKPLVHLYRSNKHSVVQEDILTYDELDQYSTPSFLVCADLMAGWMLDLKLNSSSSVAGRMGFSWSGTLMEPENNSILPAGMRHMENGMFVRECTRKDREVVEQKAAVPSPDRIRISSYNVILNPSESVQLPVTALPEGYGINDLVAVSLDPDTVSVDGLNVCGRKAGSARIRISTSDGQYSVECSVLVRSVPV